MRIRPRGGAEAAAQLGLLPAAVQTSAQDPANILD